MANLQHIADRIFRHVDVGRLPAGYSLVMGTLIDAYDEDPDFHAWVDGVTGSAIEKIIACMVCAGKWDDPVWLWKYIREATKESAA